jgi:hypothetical protein
MSGTRTKNSLQLGKSTTPYSLLLTNASNEAGYLAPSLTPGYILTDVAGVPTWVAPSSGGITTLNTLTAVSQTLVTGTTGTDFNISSAVSTHTFNIPDASTTARGLVTTGVQTFGGNKTFNNDVIVTGNFTVNGTTTTINTTNMVVTDKNIIVNNSGNDASSEGAGLTVERAGTDGSFIYKDTSATKFAIGALGAEVDVADISTSQTLSTKTLGTNTAIAIGSDAQGDVYYRGATGLLARLGIGTASQILTVNAGATAPEWAVAPVGYAGFSISDGTTTQAIASGDTVNFADGAGTNVVVSATDTVTVNVAMSKSETVPANAATTVVLGATPNFIVYISRGGLVQMSGASNDYTVSGATVTFNTAFDGTENVVIVYF